MSLKIDARYTNQWYGNNLDGVCQTMTRPDGSKFKKTAPLHVGRSNANKIKQPPLQPLAEPAIPYSQKHIIKMALDSIAASPAHPRADAGRTPADSAPRGRQV